MLWQRNRELAVALRNQGLADCLAARFALRPVDLKLFGEPISFAHLVVSKSQQSAEKLTKGYLLWHSQSFDPTKGHAPFTALFQNKPTALERPLARLIQALNVVNRTIVREVKWLESLAPQPPMVPPDQGGLLQPLEIIAENTEYPYWSAPHGGLVTSARGMTPENQGVRAFKALRNYITALSMSDPPEYCRQIGDFLEDYPMSTEVIEWPPRPG